MADDGACTINCLWSSSVKVWLRLGTLEGITSKIREHLIDTFIRIRRNFGENKAHFLLRKCTVRAFSDGKSENV